MALSLSAEYSGSAPFGYTPPHRTPTDSSYYDFNGTPWNKRNPDSQAWMYARDARAQQAGVTVGQNHPYPSPFRNREKLPLSTSGSNLRPGRGPEWLHHPLVPGQQIIWTAGNGVSRGGVRSFYKDGNTTVFDVVYHDIRTGTSARGHGRFTLATYHAAALQPLPPPTT